eukprot:TRINITY_DN13025_c0_g1_i2.p1 TRINITY_DN13025_c0_g1~~TRINITY_DN13025_c0_g1_i2.p1  ORF type:complete len:257 (-),score=5.43 TRINITY_DN13025_c0_g1_i2:82-852(-)
MDLKRGREVGEMLPPSKVPKRGYMGVKEQILKLENETPARYRSVSVSQRKTGPTTGRKPPQATVPAPFPLSRSNSCRPEVQSQTHTFKATPLNRRMFTNPGATGLGKSVKRPSTKFKEFNLSYQKKPSDRVDPQKAPSKRPLQTNNRAGNVPTNNKPRAKPVKQQKPARVHVRTTAERAVRSTTLSAFRQEPQRLVHVTTTAPRGETTTTVSAFRQVQRLVHVVQTCDRGLTTALVSAPGLAQAQKGNSHDDMWLD